MELGNFFNKFNYILVVCAITLITTDLKPVQGQRVDVEPRNITVLEGEKTQILCRWGKPLQYCRIVVPGEEKALNLSPDWDKTPGYTYFGESLEKGQCGVTIQGVRKENHGLVKCNLGADGDDLEGVVSLTVALPASRPELEIRPVSQSNIYEINTNIEATCISRDGRPASRITWLLDNETLSETSLPEIFETKTNTGVSVFTTKNVLVREIKATDDLKHLICQTRQFPDRGQTLESKIQLQVRYKPQPLPDIKIYGVVLSTTALINVTIKSNPRPRTTWIVDGQSISQGTQNGRYESYEPIDLGNGVFNVTLSIASLTLEDTVKDIYLKAGNEFGEQDYRVRISSSEAAVVNGLDMGSIIGIVLGVVLLLLIIVVIIVARVTGRWCFGDRSIITPTPKPQSNETSDTESADLKTTKTKKYNLNFEGLFRKKPQKIVDDAEKNANGDDPNDDAAPSEATVIIEDDPPKSTEKNLVYAELMLKPSEDANNPNKNSTEYAEIVYVSPNSGADQKASDKKK